jgi:hypothetical protein
MSNAATTPAAETAGSTLEVLAKAQTAARISVCVIAETVVRYPDDLAARLRLRDALTELTSISDEVFATLTGRR